MNRYEVIEIQWRLNDKCSIPVMVDMYQFSQFNLLLLLLLLF